MSTTTATVVGLGKIGLPLAVKLCDSIDLIYGLDVSALLVEQINQGNNPLRGEANLDQQLGAAVAQGKLVATTDAVQAISNSEVVLVVVPLIIDSSGQADFSSIDSAARIVGENMKAGTLVIFETTLPVGTTRTRFGPILERESGMTLERDFYLAYSPERVSSGSIFQDLSTYPKLVGGVNERSGDKATEFYGESLQFSERSDLNRQNGVWNLGTAEAAELAKLMETTYRDVNIALANQFAEHARSLGLNIYELVEAANSQPFSHIHAPGISVGGHCIPVYPHFYLMGHPTASIIAEARKVNKGVPVGVIRQLGAVLGSIAGKTIAILGLAYRGGVRESAFSGTFDLVSEIEKQGGIALVHDPLYSAEEIETYGLKPFRLGESCEVAILHTAHVEYKELAPSDFVDCALFFDGRNFAPTSIRDEMNYLLIGG